MTIEMTEQIQDIIIATQAYKKWLHADDAVRKTEKYRGRSILNDTYNYYAELVKNSQTLPLSQNCFEAVLAYPIQRTLNIEKQYLSNFTFSY